MSPQMVISLHHNRVVAQREQLSCRLHSGNAPTYYYHILLHLYQNLL